VPGRFVGIAIPGSGRIGAEDPEGVPEADAGARIELIGCGRGYGIAGGGEPAGGDPGFGSHGGRIGPPGRLLQRSSPLSPFMSERNPAICSAPWTWLYG